MGINETINLYILCFIFSSLFLYFAKLNKERDNKFLSIMLVIIAILIPAWLCGFRFYVGTNYEMYLMSYVNLGNVPLKYILEVPFEPFHFVLLKIITALGNKWVLFFFIYSLLTVLFAYLAIYKKVDKKYMFICACTYLLIIFPDAFNIIRQALAVSITMFAVYLLGKEKYKWFIVVSILACFAHVSSVIVLIFGILYMLLKKVKHRELITVSLLVIGILGIIYLAYILPSNAYTGKVKNYIMNYTRIYYNWFIIIENIMFIVMVIFLNIKRKDVKNIKFTNMLFCIYMIFRMFIYINNPISRFALYFEFSKIYIVEKFMRYFNDKFKNKIVFYIVYFIVFALLITTFLYLNVYINKNTILPYTSSFQYLFD